MRYIRLWGLVVFAVAVVVLAGAWFLLVDGAVRCMIERTGTRIVGARVELDGADVRLFPAGLTLTGLKVTNPEEPMRNAFEASRISFAVNGPDLLRRKVIVDELTAEGVMLNTARKSSGAVKRAAGRAAPGKGKKKALELPAFRVPDVQEILRTEKLAVLDHVAGLRNGMERDKAEWDNRLKALPDRAKIDGYKKRLEGLKGAGGGGIGALLGGATELVSLQKDIEKDLKSLKEAGGDLDKVIKSYERSVKDVASMQHKDVERILEKYTTPAGGLSGVSGLFFGPQAARWTEAGLQWYERLAPVVERVRSRKKGAEVVKPVRGKGVYVRYEESPPMPDLLIKKAVVGLKLAAGPVNGQILNITPDQATLARPLSFDFGAKGLKGLESLSLTGSLDHVRPASPVDTGRLKVAGLKLKDFRVDALEGAGFVVDDALLDLSADVTLKGKGLAGVVKAELGSMKVSMAGGGPELGGTGGMLAGALKGAVSGMRELSVKAEITGTLDDYDVKISSDLDRIMDSAVKGVAKEAADKLRGELSAAVSGAVKGPMAGLGGDLEGLGAMREQVEGLVGEFGLMRGDAGKGTNGGGLPGGIKLPF